MDFHVLEIKLESKFL